jgi:hypothetical protein
MFDKEEEGEAVTTCTITNQFEDLSADFAVKSYSAKYKAVWHFLKKHDNVL